MDKNKEGRDTYINMFFGSLNGNVEQHIVVSNNNPETKADADDEGLAVSRSHSEEQTDVAEAITELMGEMDDNGNWLFSKQSQWIAVYRILVDYLGWNSEYRDFCRRMDRFGSFRVPCNEYTVKRIDGIFGKPFSKWDRNMFNGAGAVFERQYKVARRLIELLGLEV